MCMMPENFGLTIDACISGHEHVGILSSALLFLVPTEKVLLKCNDYESLPKVILFDS